MVEPKTIYLEPDEEVTSVIDKLRKTEFSEVVLVVPKEAGLLHSVVNLKLIKRQSEVLGKKVSLVTQDKVGRTLADKVGLATATKVGQTPTEPEKEEREDPSKKKGRGESDNPIEETNEIVYKKKPVEEPLIEGPNEVVISEEEDTEAEANFHKKELKKEKSGNLMPRLPKKRLIAAVAVVLIILLGAGFIYLPRAKATIMVQAEKKAVSVNITGQKDAKLDTDKAVVPSQSIEVVKEMSKKYSASGKKNIGLKATGTLNISNMSGAGINWVAGTRFVPTSNTSMVYRANSVVTVPNLQIVTITVTADQQGDQYNGFGNNQTYTLAAGGLSSLITITSQSGMSGGTNKEVSYITQSDFTTAKDNLSDEALAEAATEFNKQASELKVIEDSKKETTISGTTDPEVGEEASEFTVKVKVSITALAVSLNDVGELIKSEVERQYGVSKDIIDNGSNEADISVTTQDAKTGAFTATVKSEAYLSAKMDQANIRDELVGINAAKAENYLKGLEGVESVKFEFWPPFIKLFPRLKDHIFIKIQVSDNTNA